MRRDLTTAKHMTDLKPLGANALNSSLVRLEPLEDHHVEPLRAACAEDEEIWDIYPHSMLGEHFDPVLQAVRSANNRFCFAVIDRPAYQVVGMSCYISPSEHGVVEIGFTYIAPKVRGTGLNRGMKTLMLNHAFACGYRKVEFRVDTRNKRSMAAVLKLGAQQEGVMRKNRVTWTGYVRDTAVFGLLKEEWEQSQKEDN
jgi:RimJ/RimL family protein N-acetyltransferase